MGLMDIAKSLLGGGGSASGGLDLDAVVNMVTKLAEGDENETGAAKGAVNPKVLAQKVNELQSSGAKGKKKSTTKKKVVQAAPAAAPAKEAQQSSGGGIDLGSIMGIVQKLASGGESETGAKSGQINAGTLGAVLSALTGGAGEGGDHPAVNHGSLIEMILPLLTGNSNLLADFKNNPIEVVERVTGIKLNAQSIGPIVEGILAKFEGK